MNLRQRLRIDLSDEEYRHAYADEHLNLSIGTQIKVIREKQRMTQAELAERIGTKQGGVSRLESANYNRWSTAVLRRLARAFDLRLRISFEDFGTLWEEVCNFNRESLERRQFRDDPEFQATENLLPLSQSVTASLQSAANQKPEPERTLASIPPVAASQQFKPTETAQVPTWGQLPQMAQNASAARGQAVQ